MKATDVQPGDQLIHNGHLIYTVDTVRLIDSAEPDGLPLVAAHVWFDGGGDTMRWWRPHQNLPLTGGPRIDNGIHTRNEER